MNNQGRAILMLMTLLGSGCAVLDPKAPSVIGLYGDQPVAQVIPDSKYQNIEERKYEFTYDEVFEATKIALMRKGLNVQVIEKDKGKIAATGDMYLWPMTIVVYIKQISSKPETEVIAIVDRYKYLIGEENTVQASNSFFGMLQSVLASYQ